MMSHVLKLTCVPSGDARGPTAASLGFQLGDRSCAEGRKGCFLLAAQGPCLHVTALSPATEARERGAGKGTFTRARWFPLGLNFPSSELEATAGFSFLDI